MFPTYLHGTKMFPIKAQALESAKILEQLELELYEIQNCGSLHANLSLELQRVEEQIMIQRLLLTQSSNPVSDKIDSILLQLKTLATVTDSCNHNIGLLQNCRESSEGWKVSSEADRLWSQELNRMSR